MQDAKGSTLGLIFGPEGVPYLPILQAKSTAMVKTAALDDGHDESYGDSHIDDTAMYLEFKMNF